MTIFDKLVTDTRHKLEMPQDVISEEGIKAVNRYLTEQFYERYRELRETYAEYEMWLNRDWPRSWVVGKGDYTGAFPKRVANWLFKERQIRVGTTVMQELGNIARRHTVKHSNYEFDFVTRFRWRAGAFGDAGSCYWTDNTGARDMLEENGCFAIRFFEPGTAKGIGRAWIGRLYDHSEVKGNYNEVRHRPSIETDRDEILVLFNGYGAHETVKVARILATFLGVSYKTLEIQNNGGSGGTLWLNHYRDGIHGGGRGFLLGMPEHIESVEYADFHYDSVEPERWDYNCFVCGDGLDADDMFTGADDNSYCEQHYQDRFFTCDHCNHVSWTNQQVDVMMPDETWCRECAHADATICDNCAGYYDDTEIIFLPDGTVNCTDCTTEQETDEVIHEL